MCTDLNALIFNAKIHNGNFGALEHTNANKPISFKVGMEGERPTDMTLFEICKCADQDSHTNTQCIMDS